MTPPLRATIGSWACFAREKIHLSDHAMEARLRKDLELPRGLSPNARTLAYVGLLSMQSLAAIGATAKWDYLGERNPQSPDWKPALWHVARKHFQESGLYQGTGPLPALEYPEVPEGSFCIFSNNFGQNRIDDYEREALRDLRHNLLSDYVYAGWAALLHYEDADPKLRELSTLEVLDLPLSDVGPCPDGDPFSRNEDLLQLVRGKRPEPIECTTLRELCQLRLANCYEVEHLHYHLEPYGIFYLSALAGIDPLRLPR